MPYKNTRTVQPSAKSQADLEEVELRDGLEGLTPARIATLYRRAPLRRPVDDREQLWSMFETSQVVVSAWHHGDLVGLARVLSDGFAFSYLCDLAVEPDIQRLGVGRKVIARVLERVEGTELVLRDSDLSAGFYANLGFERVDNGWSKQA